MTKLTVIDAAIAHIEIKFLTERFVQTRNAQVRDKIKNKFRYGKGIIARYERVYGRSK